MQHDDNEEEEEKKDKNADAIIIDDDHLNSSCNQTLPFIFFVSTLFFIQIKMALIMKYIDSMHHYMDKYGGKSILKSHLTHTF
jgi:hypothetical protein